MILVRPVATILPVAEATMSIVPQDAQASAAQNSRMSVAPMARPIGEGGVSTISSAAGRNASSLLRRSRARRSGMTDGIGLAALADFMDPCLEAMQRRIAAAGVDERVMAAVLDDAAALERDDAVRPPHGRQAVRDDQHRAALGDGLHVGLDDALTFVVEGAGRLVEDEDARV